MVYLPGLVLALAALWFALSGESAPLFLLFAALSVLATLLLCARLGVIGRDASPWHRLHFLIAYGVWLMGEIARANVAVVRSILNPAHPISPTIVRLDAEATSDLAKALFANSITLTPGTVTVDIEKGVFLVHALQEENASALSLRTMNRMSARAADAPGQATRRAR